MDYFNGIKKPTFMLMEIYGYGDIEHKEKYLAKSSYEVLSIQRENDCGLCCLMLEEINCLFLHCNIAHNL